MAAHSSILAWEIPWTDEPGGLQSTRSQKVGHDSSLHSLRSLDHVRETQDELFKVWLPRPSPGL